MMSLRCSKTHESINDTEDDSTKITGETTQDLKDGYSADDEETSDLMRREFLTEFFVHDFLNKKFYHYVLTNDLGKSKGWSEVNEKSWLLDSGSTIHVTNDMSDLINIQDVDVQVKSGNNTSSTATKMGEVNLTNPISSSRLKLKKVMFIPSFSKKIISAGALLNNYRKRAMCSTAQKKMVQTSSLSGVKKVICFM